MGVTKKSKGVTCNVVKNSITKKVPAKNVQAKKLTMYFKEESTRNYKK